MNCPACNVELVQRSRVALFLAGVALAAVAIVLVWLSRWLWLPAALLVITALYLMVWSGWAKGRWCRSCKKFPVRST
jgi:Flp pilus assembly protein TadB